MKPDIKVLFFKDLNKMHVYSRKKNYTAAGIKTTNISYYDDSLKKEEFI